jgi:pyruvate/2-oxoglutarate dehydrogenase complex dihydrolipoamide dehydrogenase (E3) component
VRARAVVLATGARERSRAARLLPGDRPAGVLTTGLLQGLVAAGLPVGGRRAVVVGAEAVSWSAALALRSAGVEPLLLTTELPRPPAVAALTAAGRTLLGVPVARRTRVVAVLGRRRVEAVELEHLDTGARRRVDCDTVVLTADWAAESELARAGGLTLDAGTRGPLVDTALRTDRAGVFAAGNVLHPADAADVAALDGRHVTRHVLARVRGEADGPGAARGVRIEPAPPLRWVAPGLLAGGQAPPRGHLLAWCDAHVARPRLTAVQGPRTLGRHAGPWPAGPGRVLRVPWAVVRDADPDGGAVHLHVD